MEHSMYDDMPALVDTPTDTITDVPAPTAAATAFNPRIAAPIESPSIYSWDKFEHAFAHYTRVIHATRDHTQLRCWHVVFSMGTVMMVEFDDPVPEFTGFSRDYADKLPARAAVVPIKLRAKSILERNNAIWAMQSVIGGDHGRAIRVAYELLTTRTGPTNVAYVTAIEAADTTASAWFLQWIDLMPHVLNLSVAKSAEDARVVARGLHDIDVVAPYVRAVIAPDMSVTRY